MSITNTEKLSLILGAFVSLVTLVGSVWYAAISFNNLSTSIERYSTEMSWVREALEETNEKLELAEETDEDHERRIAKMEGGFLEKVYVNHEFSIFKYKEDGNERLIKVTSKRVNN